jgi:nicotinamidase-related amidase
VTGRADKFINTTLDDILKAKGIKTAVIVGSASNGAVLYTSFGANIRGYTVVVAEDGMSTDDAFAHFLTRYQLLNQPGFATATNTPPQEGRVAVTLSRTDLISFK